MALDKLGLLIDSYDVTTGNGVAEQVSAEAIDAGFADALEKVLLDDPLRSEAYYFDKLDQYLDWAGLEKAYSLLHDHCSPAFSSLLCRPSQATVVASKSVPLKDTEHVARVREAIENLKRVNPYLADDLNRHLEAGKIVFVDSDCNPPAFVDPRNGNIVVYRFLFEQDQRFQFQAPMSMETLQDAAANTVFNGLRDMNLDEQINDLRKLFKEYAPDFQGSRQTSGLMEELQRRGKPYVWYVEEVLAHEGYHLYQLGEMGEGSRNQQQAEREISSLGLSYDLLVYQDLFSRTLDRFGYARLLDATATFNREEYNQAMHEGIIASNSGQRQGLVDSAYYVTEDKAKNFAGDLIQRLNALSEE